ncbi:PREDICTED: beta-galactoside alpha-2,6-sialyltransferase 2-like [Branchiostoma belcheri]|uniref:Beta-galactoside alpha-2,6-sialyltransferase 1 n=1 Tax=Branchiostoma belcheri TaxID=7741 RepID=A0A6P4ZYH6_BRABE|nr:PREDICTED: beta-galactoside alpha-2,6-sialyltransferase 2-like [Branchiostoma belcheri]
MATKWLFVLVTMVTVTAVFCLYLTRHVFRVETVRPKARARWIPAYAKRQGRQDGYRDNQTTTATISYVKQQERQDGYRNNQTSTRITTDAPSLSSTSRRLLCSLQTAARFRTLPTDESPWKQLGYRDIEARPGLLQLYPGGFHTCAAVMNAGAMLGSQRGKDIDSHDAVLRYNNAPTRRYESDVGTKTTLRLMNSQIVVKHSEYHWFTDPRYRNITMVLWDPMSYGGTMMEWYKKPDFDLFPAYEKRRRESPWEHVYIMDPRYLWELWEVLHRNTREKIVRNVPSSGFMGIHLLLSLCDTVDVYEYVPSMRETKRCHYYENNMDIACTYGAYHPLRAEKQLIKKLNIGPEEDVRKKGKITLPGFRTVQC